MRRPNILFLWCDQLNASVLGPYGGPVPTPNLARLATSDVVFNNATCPTPFCSPSRASLETGRYPHAHGIVHNVNRRDYPAIPAGPTEEGIKADEPTLGRCLHDAGYATHHYGKWHLLDEDLPYYPDMYTEHGAYADEMRETFASVSDRPSAEWLDWYGWRLPVEVSPEMRSAVAALGDRWDGHGHAEFVTKMGRLLMPPEDPFDARVADRVIDRLQRLGDDAFFVVGSMNYPHDPNVVPSPYYEMFDPADIDLAGNLDFLERRFSNEWSRRVVADLGEAGLREFLRLYDAATALMDDQIGRILDALDATGRSGDTIVVFAADHGDMAGGHGMVWKSTASFYDEVMRVPLIVRYPGVLTPGRSELAAGLTDIMPTLLDLAGAPIPEGVQGRSLAPWWRGDTSAGPPPEYTFCERIGPHPERRRVVGSDVPASFAVRGGGYKYARHADGEEFLYDLALDPGETRNRAGVDMLARDAMRATLDEWRRDTEYPH
ncbi:sulfatase-like hydrolase/transferase [Candidatus Poribacteria bacterium]|nr:sulfatase-like hydrolase/transferase [Candidatus Poribacteria bacterium]